MIQFRVDEERCIQCGECVQDCPMGVLVMEDVPRMVNEDGCIRCQHCLEICPTGAVSILGRNPDESQVLKGNLPDPAQVATLIKGRRAVRRYQDQDVPPALIDNMLDIACHAPTGVNANAVLFTVVKERAVLHRLREELVGRLAAMKEAGGLPAGRAGKYLGGVVKAWQQEGKDVLFRGAPHLLITSAPANATCPVQDTIIAMTTFELVAQAHGIGTVWDGICMMALAACPEVAAKLGIPDNHTVGYAMAFGLPAVAYQRTVQRGPAPVNVVQW